jgi:hypothetical protein
MNLCKITLLLLIGMALKGCLSQKQQIPKELFVCDQNSKKVLLLKVERDWNDSSQVVWSWSARESPDIPENEKSWYDYLSDAKPVKRSSHLLIAGGTGGGVALVRIADQKVVFHGYGGESPHSAELLPDGNIVVASSQDNRLRLFYAIPNNSSYTDLQLPSPHGVVWDFKRKRLWAIGHDSLYSIAYRLDSPKPNLTITEAYALPTKEGHDLFPRKNGRTLFVTTKTSVYEFDPETGVFSSIEPFSRLSEVKSISELSDHGQVAIVQAVYSWWNDTVMLFKPDENKRMYGARFYKARWNTENVFSYGNEVE